MELISLLNTINTPLEAEGVPTYIVGGFIRDSILKLPPKDLDLVIQGDKESILPVILRSTNIKSVFDDSKNKITKLTLDTSLEDTTIQDIDIQFTREDIIQNLSHRDFSINSMALKLSEYNDTHINNAVLDPFSGLDDIKSKNIKFIQQSIFSDNPIRLLRAVRLASTLKFRITPETANAIKNNAALVTKCPAENISFELLEILANDNAKAHIEILDRLTLLGHIVPELILTKGVTQPKEHYWDVWEHNLHCLEYSERLTLGHQNSPIYSMSPWTEDIKDHFNEYLSTSHTRRTHLKLASLLHDIAKPNTKTTETSGKTRFPEHELIGATMSTELLKRLKFETASIDYTAALITNHLRPHHMQQGVSVPTNRAIYRYFNDLKSDGIDVLFLHMADYLAAKGPKLTLSDWATRARIMSHVIDTHTEQVSEVYKIPKLINGNDLMTELNIKPGPILGRLIENINEEHALGNIVTPTEAISHARKLFNTIQGQQ